MGACGIPSSMSLFGVPVTTSLELQGMGVVLQPVSVDQSRNAGVWGVDLSILGGVKGLPECA